MVDGLQAKFLARFLDLGNKRVAKALELLARGTDDTAGEVKGELHALAGEASMLGYTEIAEVARGGENAARDWEENGNKKGMIGAMRALRTLNKSLAQLAADVAGPAEEEAPEAKEESGPVRVLIIDDSPINATVLCDALDEAGYESRSADQLDAIMALLSELRPQIILTDVNMPDLDCDELCGAIKADANGKKAQLYLVSGMAPAELEARAEQAGADGYVSKDAGLDSIVSQVRKLADAVTE